jgi:hypothetical protein|tara:strand:- start:931 stop:1203 length:273 start_codon:yes stop_codon:yes gene_type:complete
LFITSGGDRRHADALALLNHDLGSKYRLSRLYEWRAGTYPVPPHIQAYMMRATIASAIEEEGGTLPEDAEEFAERLVSRLLPPPRKKGRE